MKNPAGTQESPQIHLHIPQLLIVTANKKTSMIYLLRKKNELDISVQKMDMDEIGTAW